MTIVKEFTSDGVATCCRLLGLAKSTYYTKVDQPNNKGRLETKYQYLKNLIKKIIENNPAYGYRRIHAELKEKYQITLNHKPLKKLLKLWGLALRRRVKTPDKSGIVEILDWLGVRANLLKAFNNIMPFGLIYTDMTEIIYGQGKLYLIAYLDHATKKILGYAISLHPDTNLALKAYSMTKLTLKREVKRLKRSSLNLKIKEIIIHQDQGSIYTSYQYVDQLLKDQFTLSYSRKGTPTDNPEMESFFGRFKTENKQIFIEAETEKEAKQMVKKQIYYYNQKRRHSCLQNSSPNNFIKNLLTKPTNILAKN